jgi:biopolymer transport protein TolR
MRQQHPQSAQLICRIDATGFAAIMFTLVAMFLVPASIIVDSPRTGAGVAVDMAKVSHPIAMQNALREDAMVIAIQRDGKIWFGTGQVSPDDLPAAIRDRVRRGTEPKVYIRADMRARYGDVTEVLRSVRSSGIENIAFLVGERNSPAAH